MDRLTYKSNYKTYLEYGADAIWSKCEAYDVLTNAINKLAEYEDTGLTPQEIEQMKARMPLHQWAGESPEKMSIFGVSVKKIIEWANAEKQKRLVVLPCKIGDTIYRVDTDPLMPDIEAIAFVVDNIVICNDGDIIFKYDPYGGVICTLDNLINKTPYLDYYMASLSIEEAKEMVNNDL